MSYTPKGAKRPVSAPRVPLPQGAWDCHAHVFGPFDRFPLLAERRYDPPLSPAEDYLEMLDTVGFAHGVIAHAAAKGHDMSNVADALARRPDRLIGVAVPHPDLDDAGLDALHAQGFRAIRITENGRGTGRTPGTLYFDDLRRFAPRLKRLGWHVQIWGRCDLVMRNAAELAGYGVPIIFDHLGFSDASKGADDLDFRAFLKWIRTGDFWVKWTLVRISTQYHHHSDARPLHDALFDAVPDRVVFGSDWPYLSLDDDPPDVGKVVDLFDAWTKDDTIRRKVFVDNPRSFYLR